MTPDQYQSLESLGGATDLSARAKFALVGADRVRYLNGQVTNDVRSASVGAAIYACVTNAKGRIEGDVFIHASGGAEDLLLLDAEEGLKEHLGARLERYIVADDVELRDVTGDWRLWHFFGPAAEAARQMPLPGGASRLDSNRLGVPGVDVWISASGAGLDLPPDVPLVSPEDWETLRILKGVPRWPHEINSEAFPQEAALESRAMSFTKGCYIGQEILSRIKLTGKMPRRLVSVQVRDLADDAPAQAPEAAPWIIYDGSQEPPKAVGEITSLTHHPVLDRPVGLAYVRHGLEAGDSLLLGSEEPPRIFAKVDICPT
jgi:folate-binding protein YgfZ